MSDIVSTVTNIGYEVDTNAMATKKLAIESQEIDTSGGQLPTAETIDELLASSSGWITPMEYYAANSAVSVAADGNQEGYLASAGGSSVNMGYFWVDDLKNWCRYLVYNMDMNGAQEFILCVWNGRNGWIPVNEFFDRVVDESEPTFPADDKYGISLVQHQFLSDYSKRIIQHRGLRNSVFKAHYKKVGGSNVYRSDGYIVLPAASTQYEYTVYEPRNPVFLQVIQAIRLQKSEKYTVNEEGTFQTVRWSSLYVGMTSKPTATDYAQTNFRAAVSTGAPCLWRLPTGEIALCTKLQWNAEDGIPYYYKKEASNGFTGFRRRYWFQDNLTDSTRYDDVTELNMLGSEMSRGSSFINSVCSRFFGTGSDKTIEYDWLREYNPTVDTRLYMAAADDYTTMLDSTLSFEQHNINKENSLKCAFTVNRPIATTNMRPEADYAKKW